MNSDTKKTLGGTKFGSSLKDLEDGDLSRGYFNAAPEGQTKPAFSGVDLVEADEPGFLSRPRYKCDVERN